MDLRFEEYTDVFQESKCQYDEDSGFLYSCLLVWFSNSVMSQGLGPSWSVDTVSAMRIYTMAHALSPQMAQLVASAFGPPSSCTPGLLSQEFSHGLVSAAILGE